MSSTNNVYKLNDERAKEKQYILENQQNVFQLGTENLFLCLLTQQ